MSNTLTLDLVGDINLKRDLQLRARARTSSPARIRISRSRSSATLAG
jgi:hypothetical protein